MEESTTDLKVVHPGPEPEPVRQATFVQVTMPIVVQIALPNGWKLREPPDIAWRVAAEVRRTLARQMFPGAVIEKLVAVAHMAVRHDVPVSPAAHKAIVANDARYGEPPPRILGPDGLGLHVQTGRA